METVLHSLPALAAGAAVTLELTLAAAALALPCAFAAGIARGARHATPRWAAAVYVETFRGTSALVQLFWVYFALPLVGISLTAMTAGVAVLGLNAGAYGAEVVRGALAAVAPEQTDAAIALGFSPAQRLRRILVPQALPAMLPPFGNLLVELLKNTALVSLITISDLAFEGQLLRSATLRSGEVFGVILLIYFAMAQVLIAAMRRIERRAGAGIAGATGR